MAQDFSTTVFEKEQVNFGGTSEFVVRGGRNLFSKLPEAFKGIKQVGVIGWGSQGPAQAQNLRDSLEGTDIKVVVGLREGSSSMDAACKAGFHEDDGTLSEMFKVISESDFVILLISDAAQTEQYQQVFEHMKDGATLGLSHGFLLGFMETVGATFPKNINVVGVCPKGMGPSVRRLYEQGRTADGAGINCSFAVNQDIDGRATDIALGWAIALGAPFSFPTTLTSEYKSDIFGERCILLGGVHGMVEAMYAYLTRGGTPEEEAFSRTAESVTGKISEAISHRGIKGLYDELSNDDKAVFAKWYEASYQPMYEVISEVYDEVASGNEIRSVVLANDRLKKFGWTKVDGSHMWRVGEKVRAARPDGKNQAAVDPAMAGIYAACMMAQIDVLQEHGHAYSEIVNESVIEAVDSLNPYMNYKGVDFMVDNCSTTARLGSRKWAPHFHYALEQAVFPNIDTSAPGPKMAAFESHNVHQALQTALSYRPTVDIAVQEV